MLGKSLYGSLQNLLGFHGHFDPEIFENDEVIYFIDEVYH
jgi:hypothetical protein